MSTAAVPTEIFFKSENNRSLQCVPGQHLDIAAYRAMRWGWVGASHAASRGLPLCEQKGKGAIFESTLCPEVERFFAFETCVQRL